jgi:hypothetical protein
MAAVDPNSETWRVVKAHVTAQLATYREQVETQGIPPDETENLRGAIAELKALLKLAPNS